MSREKYISELYLRLLWKCSKKDRMEIICDIKEYYEIALSSGKPELVIFEELGTPKDVIGRITKEVKQEEPDDTYTFEWIVRCIAIFAYVAILVFLITPLGNANFITLSLLMPLEGILLWYVLGGKLFCRTYLMDKQETGIGKIIILHIIYFVASIVIAGFFISAGLGWLKWMWFVKSATDFGPIIKSILMVMLVLFTAMYVTNILAFHRVSIKSYSLAIHALGAIWMIFAFLHMLLAVTDPVLIMPFFIKSMLIYIEGIILALGFLFYSHKMIKREGL